MPGTRRSAVLVLANLLVVIALLLSPHDGADGKRRNKRMPKADLSGWELTFSEDFRAGKLDLGTWTTAFPWGRDRSSVGELQYYAPDAFGFKKGKLRIMARRNTGGAFQYDSGLISSHQSFTQEYGRFEIRCKVPRGKGLWPAFWLLPVDTSWPPEIDVFEALGQDPDTVHMTMHYLDGGEHRQKGKAFSGPDFSKRFHTFAVEWQPGSIVWFVDGIERHRVNDVSPQGQMYILANLAVGGEWPGAPSASTKFPAAFQIDYIRAYRAKGAD